MNKDNYYPPFSAYSTVSRNISTILRSELTELRRLSPGVDLVSYDEDGHERPVAFKYQMDGWNTDRGLWISLTS